jgi:hypothetical protein
MEIDWHKHQLSSHVKVDTHSSSSGEHITTLDEPNRSCIGCVITLRKLAGQIRGDRYVAFYIS